MLNRISSNSDDHRCAISGGSNNFMIDGKPVQTLSAGLGCVLISRPIFKKYDFRYIEGQSWFPDVVFINDLYRSNQKYFAHTGVICEHRNSKWGEFGKDYN